MSAWRQWAVLAAFVVICLALGGLGSVFTARAIPEWYAALHKPAWTPPAWLFGPVWTLLYIGMGVAAWLVWRRWGAPGVGTALAIFAVQLLLNAIWTPLFFGLRQPGWAFAEILLLWAAIVAAIIAFRPISTVAAWLLVPYLAWVTYAGALNFFIWRLNP